MAIEISIDIFLVYLKISMIVASAMKTSVKLYTDILCPFSKCPWKFPSTFLSIEDMDDILLLLAKRWWKISMIFSICL